MFAVVAVAVHQQVREELAAERAISAERIGLQNAESASSAEPILTTMRFAFAHSGRADVVAASRAVLTCVLIRLQSFGSIAGFV